MKFTSVFVNLSSPSNPCRLNLTEFSLIGVNTYYFDEQEHKSQYSHRYTL